MRAIARTALSLVVLLALPLPLWAASTGTANNGAGCFACHGVVPNGSVAVMIDGPDEVPAGGSALFTAWIAPAGVGAGIDASLDFAARAAGWEVAPVDPLLRNFGTGSVVHSDAHPQVWSFDFELVAPLTPTDATLSVAMMAFNGDGHDTSMDVWNTATALVTVPEPSGSAAAALLALALAGSTGGRRFRRGTLLRAGSPTPARRKPCPWTPASSVDRRTRTVSRSMHAG